MTTTTGAVVIGRNEGPRLEKCLASLSGEVDAIVYVDSGSTDGSREAAHATGAEVVELDTDLPFTAARARNAGFDRLISVFPDIKFVQFLDGDCELVADWISAARRALDAEPGLAVVCGRRRERFPDASIWNRLVDFEWDTPVGEAKECGGDALMRREVLESVGGFREDMIAGEEPELCFRMREKGWRVLRLNAEMTRHDAAMTKASQWWRRSSRAGYAYALGASLHGASEERYRIEETRRSVLWGLALPITILLLALIVSPWLLLLALIWPLQILRMRLKMGRWDRAVFLTLGKFPEAQGVMQMWADLVTGRRRGLIEYK